MNSGSISGIDSQGYDFSLDINKISPQYVLRDNNFACLQGCLCTMKY